MASILQTPVSCTFTISQGIQVEGSIPSLLVHHFESRSLPFGNVNNENALPCKIYDEIVILAVTRRSVLF